MDDTLYCDSHDTMIDWHDGPVSAGVETALAMMRCGPEEPGQTPAGIWALFGVEAVLSAAGQPSRSEECSLIREWGEGVEFRPNPEQLEEMKKAVRAVLDYRRDADDGHPDFLPSDAEAVGKAMLDRIDRVEPGDGIPPKRTSPSSDSGATHKQAPTPQLESASADDLPLEIPGWWDELLERAAEVESDDPFDYRPDPQPSWGEVLRRVERAEPRVRLVSYRPHHPAFQDENEELVAWLIDRAASTLPGEFSALGCALHPRRLGESEPALKHGADALLHAYDTILAVVRVTSPAGLKEFLPGAGHPGAELLLIEEESTFAEFIRHLIEGWTGISSTGLHAGLPERGEFAAEFWNEVREAITPDGPRPPAFLDYARGDAQAECIRAQLFFSAWCAGDCTAETYRAFYRSGNINHPFGVDARRLHFRDSRVPEFIEDHKRTLADLGRAAVREGNFKLAGEVRQHGNRDRGLEFLVAAAQGLERGKPFRVAQRVAFVDVVEPGEVEPALGELRKLSQETLRRLLPHAGHAIPLLLEVIDDADLVTMMRVVLGTFSEPLVPNTIDRLAGEHGGARSLHPGRAPCGVTDLNPFFDGLANCPSQTYEDILDVLDDTLPGQGRTVRLQHLAGLPSNPSGGFHYHDQPEVGGLCHRLPSGAAEREGEIRRRIRGFAAMFQRVYCPNRDFIIRWGLGQLRDAAHLHAEAAGRQTWIDAAFEMAECLRCDEPCEIEAYTLVQTPLIAPGYAVRKGKRILKNPPKALVGKSDLESFVAAGGLRHLVGVLLRMTILENWVETGERPEEAFAKRYEEQFGADPRAWLEDRAALRLPAESREIVARALDALWKAPEDDRIVQEPRQVLPDFQFRIDLFLPSFREHGWVWDLDRGRAYRIEREFRRFGVGFELDLRDSDGRVVYAESNKLPKDVCRLGLYRVRRFKGRGILDSAIRERLIDLMLQDILLAGQVAS